LIYKSNAKKQIIIHPKYFNWDESTGKRLTINYYDNNLVSNTNYHNKFLNTVLNYNLSSYNLTNYIITPIYKKMGHFYKYAYFYIKIIKI
jgi:hypothetical protein